MRKSPPKEKTKRPLVSIVIPCRNEIRYIGECLTSIYRTTSIREGFEVIVVDGLSTDGTREAVRKWAKRHANLTLIDNPNRSAPHAFNLGVKNSKGRYLFIISAHSRYDQQYFKLCVDTFTMKKADVVGGHLISILKNKTYLEKMVKALTTHRFGIGNSRFRLASKAGYADTVPFGCYRRAIFKRIGMFDERLIRNQDYELNRRIIKQGGKIWRDPKIRVKYYNRSSIQDLFRQAFSTGRWNALMWHVAPYAFAFRHAVPGAFVFILIFLLASSIWISVNRLLLIAMVSAYLILAVKAAIDQSRRISWKLFPLLPWMFFSYHLAYGLGTLKGLIELLSGKAQALKRQEPWPGAKKFHIQTFEERPEW